MGAWADPEAEKLNVTFDLVVPVKPGETK